MRKILSIVVWVVMSLPLMAGIHTYADQSVLQQGTWVKIRVSETGVCRMSFSELQSAGLNPQQVRVFGYGGAQLEQDFTKRKIDDLPQVPVYVGSDYILFWAQGPIDWSYNGSRFSHTRNTYSDYGYYLLTDDAGSLLAPTEGAAVSGTPTEVYTYVDRQVHDYDSINLIDRAGVHGGGRTFYGEQFAVSKPRTFFFDTPNAIEDETATAHVELAAFSRNASYFYGHLNEGTERYAYATAVDDIYTFGTATSMDLKGTITGGKQQVQIHMTNSSTGALGWLNFIELTVPSALTMQGSYLPVRTNINYMNTTPVRFHLSGADANTMVWDVTDLAAIQAMPTTLTKDTLSWTGSQQDGIHEYVAINPQGTKWVEAKVVGKVANQNLHALKNIDYVIICPEGYETYAEDLAAAHEEKQAITWAVVTDQQVYNEFSSGTPDATAYRWLMKMLYDRANGNDIQKPRWLLLFGHGSFDNRNILVKQGVSTSGVKLLLTYQAKDSENEVNAYCTDDYFGFLDDNEGLSDTQGRMDIGVGRLPVYNKDEARATVDKLISYIHNTQIGKWKNQIVFLADDGENGQHTQTAEGSSELLRVANPNFVVNKIYLDAYPQEVNASGESYPLAKSRVTNLLRSGALFFDYSGHGSSDGVTNEGVLRARDIEAMNNKNQAFWLFATCSFALCDAGKRSAAEAAVLNPNGGAIGVFASTRTVYAAPNTKLNRAVCAELFAHDEKGHYEATLGEAIAQGKNNLGNDANKMAYVLLGDPAMRLNFPTDYLIETTTPMDTLHALSVQHVEAQIIDEDSAVVSDFNGKVDITIYDKLQVIHTRDNDATEDPVELAYNDYPNIIFSGTTQVEDGKFEYTFMVPKDIRYNYGNGRIVYYAQTADSLETAEAVGYNEQFVVGGSSSVAFNDTTGPQMQIYLNTKAFRDGDKTYATPRFFADLYDENGINTAGAGIGHDLMLIIDDDPTQIYSLNEYFTASNNSYQAGQVSYLMESMKNGSHHLTFRAWDLLNNSTTQTLNFIVEAGMDPSICSVTTYPNPVPASGMLRMMVEYDQPDQLLQTEVYLYNTNGQMIYRSVQDNPEDIRIYMMTLGLQPGVYIYHINMKSAAGRFSTTSGKVIVTK